MEEHRPSWGSTEHPAEGVLENHPWVILDCVVSPVSWPGDGLLGVFSLETVSQNLCPGFPRSYRNPSPHQFHISLFSLSWWVQSSVSHFLPLVSLGYSTPMVALMKGSPRNYSAAAYSNNYACSGSLVLLSVSEIHSRDLVNPPPLFESPVTLL